MRWGRATAIGLAVGLGLGAIVAVIPLVLVTLGVYILVAGRGR